MHVHVTCKNEEDPIKNEGASANSISFIVSLWEIYPVAQGQLTPQSVVESG